IKSYLFVSLYFLVCIQSQEVPRLVFLKTANLGDNVTLHCGVLDESIFILNWFKITVGERTDFNLIIRDINKEDEANYFCNQGTQYKNGNKGNISITVVQQPVSASAQLGDPVALQCSITSQRTDHSNQCQGEPSVYWFRSGPSHPAAIYMNGNRSGECQNSSGPPSAPQSCVYTLPKNNVDSSDAGTYYCALAASCGEAVFGNGTKLDITGHYILLPTSSLLWKDGETNSLNYAELEFSGRKNQRREEEQRKDSGEPVFCCERNLPLKSIKQVQI
uniref:Ig-like domain-containing protein n=1 Tax=Gadus morhua TaxID=8049 RepID=A0A8C5CBM7_GADMO